LDLDAKVWPEELNMSVQSQGGWDAVLEAVFSEFAGTPFVVRPSSSAFVTNTENGKHTGTTSYHAYYPVKSGADVAGFAQRLHERLILKGYGYAFISKTGDIFVRSLIDVVATSDYSRLWYEADAILADERLSYRQPREVSLKQEHGDFLDTTVLSPLNDEERVRFEQECHKIKAVAAPEAEEVRKGYIAIRKAALISRGTSPDIADKILRLAVETHVLAEDFEIALNDGSLVTVAEILDDPQRYDGQECPDPMEPDYGNGRSLAMIMLSSGKPHIKSFAHGGRKFELVKDYALRYFEEFEDVLADEARFSDHSSILPPCQYGITSLNPACLAATCIKLLANRARASPKRCCWTR
jgi:hypothetical protein